MNSKASKTNPNGVLVAEGLNGVAEFPKIPLPDVVDGVAPNIPPLPVDAVVVVAPNIPLGAGADAAPKIPELLDCDGAELVDVKAGLAPNIPPARFFVSPKANPLVGVEVPKVLLLLPPDPNALPGACVVDF